MSKIEEAENALRQKLEQDPDWDSGSDNDDDDAADDPNQKLVQEILGEAKKQLTTKSNRRNSRRNVADSVRNAVLYIGHLPPHFEEAELAGFLKQFGGIVNLKVVRSAKTGRSRGYAFVQMKSPDTAAIIADTLSGYIVMGTKRLVCHRVPADKVHRGLFARTKNLTPSAIRAKKKQTQTKSLGKIKQVTSRLVQRERKKRDALKEMGIDYDFPGYEESFEKMEKKKDEETLADKNKRKDSISSMTSEKSDTSLSKRKKRKEKKSRKDSLASVDGTKFDSSQSSERKRKDSLASIDSVGSEGSKAKKRRNSLADPEEEASAVKKTAKKSSKKSRKRRSL